MALNSHVDSVNGVAEHAIEEERISAAQALRGDAPDSLLLVCTYTNNEILAHIPKGEHGKGIYSWRLDGSTGKLSPSPTAVSNIEPNPAFLLKHPTLDVLYASTECIHEPECGEVVTLGLNGGDGRVEELGRTSAGGRSTCYLTMNKSGSVMAAVNYWDSIVSLLPVSPENGIVAPAPCHAHMQPGAQYVFEKNPDRVEHWTHRQRWPHTHCFVTPPSYHGSAEDQEVHLVCDLGQDTIWAYRIHGENGAVSRGGGRDEVAGASEQPTRLEVVAGAKLEPLQGPRHLVFHPRCKTAYVINELKSTVSVLHFHPERLDAIRAGGDMAAAGAPALFSAHHESSSSSPAHLPASKSFLVHAETLRTLPSDFECTDHHKSHASEIRIHPSGKWLLIANRGHDSIAVYRIDEDNKGALTLAHITPSGGLFPRNFNFDVSGHWVIVGNQNSNNLTVFSFDFARSGAMSVVDVKHQPSPNFVFSLPPLEPSAPQRVPSPARGSLYSSMGPTTTRNGEPSHSHQNRGNDAVHAVVDVNGNSEAALQESGLRPLPPKKHSAMAWIAPTFTATVMGCFWLYAFLNVGNRVDL